LTDKDLILISPELSKRSPVEFGDFQTPVSLANQVLKIARDRIQHKPKSIFEPTCGVGNLLFAALETFPNVSQARGFEINPAYVLEARSRSSQLQVTQADFFTVNLKDVFAQLEQPVLIVGNPPWVTNAAIAASGGTNLPSKQTQQGFNGLEAMTGKSNFDLSEAILQRLLERISRTQNTLAMIVKTAVARKLLQYASRQRLGICNASMYAIDAKREFGAAVDACVFYCDGTRSAPDYTTQIFQDLNAKQPSHSIGFQGSQLIADTHAHARAKEFIGPSPIEWRSGIKHDAAKVMELWTNGEHLENGLGERVDLETMYLFPMFKSSDLGNSRTQINRAFMLVPQRFIGEPTHMLEQTVPKTWAYLNANRDALEARGSSIYKNNPPFSIFGVGEYSFGNWKVAISGMYKIPQFSLIGPLGDKPVVFDDTCYFLPCKSEAQARVIHAILNSNQAQDVLRAIVFWDEKRPITKERLNQINLTALANVLEDQLLPKLLENVAVQSRDAIQVAWKTLARKGEEVPSLFG
jgi:hypothetical protein